MTDITETVDEIVEEIAVDAVMEKQKDRGDSSSWDGWVALSSSVLAVLSALAALYATFAVDEFTLIISNGTDYAAYQEGSMVGLNVLKAKVDILNALDKPVSTEDTAQMKHFEEQILKYHRKADEADRQGNHKLRVHDRLAISVTLFQVAILMGGLAVIVRRKSIWMFGLSFSFFGFGMLLWGLLTF